MEQEKLIKWAAVGVGLVISVAVLWMGLLIVQGKFGKAADLNVTNFACEPTGENALLVTWEDTSKDKGVVYYRPAGTSNNFIALEESNPQEGNGSNSHEVTLSLLTSGTTYEVQVGSGGQPTEEVHQCSTTQQATSNSLLPTSSIESVKATPSPAPTTAGKLSVNEIMDRLRDGTFKNTTDCASSSQTTALDCAKAARALYAVQGQSVSR